MANPAYQEFLRDKADGIKRDPKSFWRFIDERRRIKSIPDSLQLNDHSASGRDRCELFSTFFGSSFGTSPNTSTSVSSSLLSDFEITAEQLNDIPTLTISDVHKLLRGLDSAKGAGPDGFPPSFFKRVATAIALPLLLVFNASIRERTFPSLWKVAHVTSIFKSGSRSSVSNYRGISILSCPAKMLELHVTNFLTSHIRNI